MDKQKLDEARLLAHSMISHPVAYSTIDHVEKAGDTIVDMLADRVVLVAQVNGLRAALVKVLEARDKEAKAAASYRVARDNFSAGGRMEAADHLLVLQQLASSAEREARLLLATLKVLGA